MRVLVIGCGYIGFAVAEALRKAGHHVTGLIRPGNVLLRRRLQAVEVNVLEANARNVQSYLAAIESADVIIDSLSPAPGEAVNILNAVADVAKRTKKTRRYIFTDGVMTYGDQGGNIVDESSPINPAVINEWKAKYAESLTARNNAADYLETVDVRPGWLYGKDFGHYLDWFAIGPNDPITVLGSKDNKWPWVHVSDCASAFVAIVEAPGSVVGGQIFNITDDTNATNLEIQIAFAKAAGRKEEDLKFEQTDQVAIPFLLYSLRASSAKLQNATGWKPKCGPLLGNEHRLYRAWKAFHRLYKL